VPGKPLVGADKVNSVEGGWDSEHTSNTVAFLLEQGGECLSGREILDGRRPEEGLTQGTLRISVNQQHVKATLGEVACQVEAR
jgi:hypothetical protein